ncbi:MAG: FAD-dependent monooxygenase [Patulibacter sp.]
MQETLEIPVLIVGGGPTGLAAAIELGRHGVPCLLAERHAATRPHPRASVVNVRSMELCRAWGIAEEVLAHAMPLTPELGVTWTTSLAGREIGRLLLLDDIDRVMKEAASSPVIPAICPQDRFEPLLRERAEREPSVDLRFRTEVVSLVDHGDHARAELVDADGQTQTVRAQWVIAADGARSRLRDDLGIDLEGPADVSQQVNVYFHADLGPLVEGRSSVLLYVANRAFTGFLIALDGRHRWLLNVARELVPSATPEGCAAIVAAAIGDPDVETEIVAAYEWTVTAQVATRYRAGRVLLAGDAAHRFPHTGGFGMNTGIQDAHNLAWKLAAVVRCDAGDGLLDSYDEERRPVGLSNCAQSLHNARAIADTGISFAGDGFDLSAVDDDTPEGQAVRERIVANIPRQRPHFAFRGQEIGFQYRESSAVVDDGSGPAPYDVETYVPDGRPGVRAPHLWIDVAGEQRSTLDLWDGRWAFLGGPDSTGWKQAAALALADVPFVRFGVDFTADAEQFAAYGLGDEGALLVRPDGHVAWRARGRAPLDAPDHLRTAIGLILDRPKTRSIA